MPYDEEALEEGAAVLRPALGAPDMGGQRPHVEGTVVIVRRLEPLVGGGFDEG